MNCLRNYILLMTPLFHRVLLIESFKVVIIELKVLNAVTKRRSVLEDINAISINTTDYLKIENGRLNDELI